MRPIAFIDLSWCLWWASWLMAAFWSHPTLKRLDVRKQVLHRLPTLVGCIFLFGIYDPLHISRSWIGALAAPWGWVCVGLTVFGFCFCWWARLHLGQLWSSAITKKTDHKIVDTGPYRLVRHPIYTGLIFSALATAAAYATGIAALGAALMVLGFFLKARQEEGFLRDELGAAAYNAYAAYTPMLVPFLRW